MRNYLWWSHVLIVVEFLFNKTARLHSEAYRIKNPTIDAFSGTSQKGQDILKFRHFQVAGLLLQVYSLEFPV